MKLQNIRLGYFYAFLQRHLTQGIVDSRDVNGLRALHRTGVATDADPNAGAFQDLFFQAQLGEPDHEVRGIIHGADKWAASRAGLAVPAQIDIHTGSAFDLFPKILISLANVRKLYR